MEGFDPVSVCGILQQVESLNDHSTDYKFLRLSSPILFSSCCSSHSSFLLDCILRRLLREVDGASRSTANILFSSSTIKRIVIVSREQKVPLPSDLSDLILLYAHKFWDFVIDVVSYDATEAFNLTLLSHMEHCEQCQSFSDCPWLQGVVRELFQSNSRCRAVYKSMMGVLRASPSLCRPFFDLPFIHSLYSSLSNHSAGVALTELLCECLSNGYGSWEEHIGCLSSLILCPSSPASSLTGIYERLLPAVARHPRIGAPFLIQLLKKIQDSSSPSSLSAILSVARFSIAAGGGERMNWKGLIGVEEMTRAILHVDGEVRFSGWSLLIEHPKKTEPFSVEDCRLMGAFLETSMGEQRPAIRQKILSGVKKVLIRLVEVGEKLLSKSCQEEEKEREEKLEEYGRFIDTIVQLAFQSLQEGANFPRRLMALSMLDLIYRQKVLVVPKKARLLSRLSLSSHLTPSSISALIHTLDDPYEICQSTALNLLTAIHNESPLAVPLSSLRSSTLEMLLTISTHITMATGYRIRFLTLIDREETLSLLSSWFLPRISARLDSSSSSLSSLIAEPLHPLMNAVELILNEMGSDPSIYPFLFSYLPLLHSISAVVSPLVHNMSPEGYLPADFKLPGTTTTPSSSPSTTPSQMLLACAWRAHKHVSTTMGWAVQRLPYPSILSDEMLSAISAYFLKQLTECKHCGAFESAVDGFEILATRMWSIGGEKRGTEPEKWLIEAMKAIEGENGSLCLTRRSAGLPHLIVSLLVTEPAWSQSQLLLSTLTSLLNLEEKSLDTRVHSYNVAKAIVSCSRLAEKIAPALEVALLTAISGCSSPEWPARNSASQLLSALISRVFGVPREGQKDLRPHHHNQMSAAEFFARFPSLVDFLLSSLRPCPSSLEFSLFPSLVILSHLFPSSAAPLALTPFIPRVLQVLLSSRAEKVRALAAVSLSAISTREDVSLLLSWIGRQSAEKMRQNEANAVLMMMSAFLDRKIDDDYEEGLSKMREIVREWQEKTACSEWCDWNLAHLLSISSRLGLPLADLRSLPPLSSLTLSLRPLAAAWIQCKERRQEMPLSSSPAFRHEIYRSLLLQPIDNNRWTIDELVPYLLKDLAEEAKETNRLIILRLLMVVVRGGERMEREERREEIRRAMEGIQMERKRLPEESMLRAIRMAVREGEKKKEEEKEEEREWMMRCTSADDEETKEMAIECAAAAAADDEDGGDDVTTEVLLEFLQDESAEIREKAAIVLGERLFGEGTRLNPFVLRIGREKEDEGKREEEEEKVEKEEKGMHLFEAMVENPYREERVIGECRYTREIISQREACNLISKPFLDCSM